MPWCVLRLRMNERPPIWRVAVNILNRHTDHYLVVAEVRERLTVSKQEAQKFDVQRFNLRKLSELEVRKQ